MILNFSH